MPETIETAAMPRARPFPWFAYALLALVGTAGLLAGLYLLYGPIGREDLGTVNQIRITAKPGIDLSKIEEILDTPDYYLEVWTGQGKQATETFKDTRVGSGLTFDLPVPLRLLDVKEVRLLDSNVMKDDLVDRVDRPARTVTGERFQFELAGAAPAQPLRTVGFALAICGAAILLIVVLRFIWFQVI